MGFLQPDMPVVDFAEWSKGTRSEKIRPMAGHWAEVGFGTPVVMHLFYVFKILLYILGGWLFALATKGVDGFTNVGAVVDRADRVRKGRALHNAVRGRRPRVRVRAAEQPVLPADGVDPVLVAAQHHSAAAVAQPGAADEGHRAHARGRRCSTGPCWWCCWWRCSPTAPGRCRRSAPTVGVLPLWQIWTILGLLAVLGLRDKVIFLAARGEVYGSFAVAFLFAGYGVDMIIAAKLVCVAIWMGAATSKLNKHFPFVISTMMSNNPLIRTKWLKRRFFERFPDDLRPGPGVAIHRAFQHRDRDAGAVGAVVLPRRLADGDRRIRDGLLPLRHPVGDPDGRAAGVERVHDLLGAGAVRRPRRCGPVAR